MTNLELSQLPHTWLIDVDGTLVKHNGHKDGRDVLLPGVIDFWRSLPEQDTVILMSARTQQELAQTIKFFKENGMRFDLTLFGLPTGERILINDRKRSGLETAIAIGLDRDAGLSGLTVSTNASL